MWDIYGISSYTPGIKQLPLYDIGLLAGRKNRSRLMLALRIFEAFSITPISCNIRSNYIGYQQYFVPPRLRTFGHRISHFRSIQYQRRTLKANDKTAAVLF